MPDNQQTPFAQARAEALFGDEVGFKVKWLINIHDPSAPDADMDIAKGFHETLEEAKRHYKNWLKGKLIGPPKATDTYTTEQLIAMGVVGLYKLDGLFDPEGELVRKEELTTNVE